MRKWIEIEHTFGDIVYLKTDKDQAERMVFEICISQNTIMYGVCAGTIVSRHYEFELSKDINVLKTV